MRTGKARGIRNRYGEEVKQRVGQRIRHRYGNENTLTRHGMKKR